MSFVDIGDDDVGALFRHYHRGRVAEAAGPSG